MKVVRRLLVSALGFSMGIGLGTGALAYALEVRWGVGQASGGSASDSVSAGKELYIAKGGGGGGGAGGGGAGGAGGGGAGGAGGGGAGGGGAGGAGGGGASGGGAGGAGGGGASGGGAGGAGGGGAGAAGGAGASGGGAAAGGGGGAGAAGGGAAAGAGSAAGPAGGSGGAGAAGAGDGSPGGIGDSPGSGSPGSQSGAVGVAILDLARADLAAGAFVQAQSRAESVLRTSVPARVRATALVLAGDAAYGLGAYRTAANRYGEALQADQLPAEAAHTGFALGWAALRLGRHDQARYVWVHVARQFPAEPGAALALIQAAELAAQAGDLASAQKRLDQVLESYPTAPEAELARLSRSIVALRAGRTREAVRDLRTLALSGRPSLPQERRMLLDRLSPAGAFTGPERLGTAATGLVAAHESDTAAPSDTAGALERFAAPFLDGAGDPETTPRVLHGLVYAAADDKAWPEVERLSSRLVSRFPGYPAAPDVLLWVAARAASAQQWPIVRSSYEQVLALDRSATLTPPAQVNFAEALFRTDAPAQARVQLSRLLEVAPQADDAPRALHLLAEVNEALDRPAEALAAYDRLRRDYPGTEWTAESLLPHARLLQHAIGRQQEARALLEEAVQRTQGDALTEASFRLAQLLAADGEHQHAVDWYMSAAYGTGQSSRWYRPALLGAGRSLAALHRTSAAEAVYGNLLPSAPAGPLPRDGRRVEGLREKVEDPKLAAEAAYGVAELRRGAGRNAEAVDMYLTAASLAPGSDQAWRGLVGAIRALVAIRDWKSAAAIYQRLAESHGSTPEIRAEAMNALGPPRRDSSGRAR